MKTEKIIKITRTKSQTGEQARIYIPPKWLAKLEVSDYAMIRLEQNQISIYPIEIKIRK